MSSLGFLQDLTVVLSIAAVVILIFRKLKQPPVLGYLAAGMIIGPFTPPRPLITDMHSLEALAEIGVVFLLFALGAEFNLRRLGKVGLRGFLATAVEIALMMAFGWVAGALLGWAPTDRVLFGAAVAVASTAIVVRALLERARHPAGWEDIVSGALVAEDMLAVLLIAFLSSAAKDGVILWSALVPTAARFAMLVTLVLIVGLLVIPRLLRAVEHSGVDEVRTLVLVGSCFGVSLITQKLGFSSALGAFLAGTVASTGGSTPKLHETVAPFKDLFGAIFFVSVGMLINPRWLVSHWELALGLTLAVVAARFLANFVAFIAIGEEKVHAVQSAVVRLPIGEFSFLLAHVAQRESLAREPLYLLAVALCLGTTFASAMLTPVVTADSERVRALFPRPVAHLLDGYRGAVKKISAPSRAAMVWRLLWPSLLQIVINIAGIGGLFIGAGALQDRHGLGLSYPGVLWTFMAFASLPFVNALVRKCRAVILILLEALHVKGPDGRTAIEARPVLARFLLNAASVAIVWWVVALSWRLLPPWPYAAAPLALVTIAAAFLWRGMNRFYAQVQVALKEVWAWGEADSSAAATALSHFAGSLSPQKVHLSECRIGAGYWAVGKDLSEVRLRSETGASILQVARDGKAIPAPGPDLRLIAHDGLLIIGEADQIRRAKHWLERGP